MRIIKLVVVSLTGCVLDRKVTLRTLCTYDQHLRTLFIERCPDSKCLMLFCVVRVEARTRQSEAENYGVIDLMPCVTRFTPNLPILGDYVSNWWILGIMSSDTEKLF